MSNVDGFVFKVTKLELAESNHTKLARQTYLSNEKTLGELLLLRKREKVQAKGKKAPILK